MLDKDVSRLEKAHQLAAEGGVFWREGQGARALPFYAQAHYLVTGRDTILAAERLDIGANYALILALTGQTSLALEHWADLLILAQTHQLSTTQLVRQTAVTHELRRELGQATALLDQIRPDEASSDDARLKWHNAYGIIEWRQGRIAQARSHFCAAVNALPTDPTAAGLVRAVLSNAATLDYEIGRIESGHAYAEQMDAMADLSQTFATQRGLLRLRAIRADLQGDQLAAAKHWQDAFALVLSQTPNDTEHLLEFATLAAANFRKLGDDMAAEEIIEDVLGRCPDNQRHLASSAMVLQAELLLDIGHVSTARNILNEVVQIEAVRDDAEREVPLLAALARVAAQSGAPYAAVLLGKMALTARLNCGVSLQYDDITALLTLTKEAALRLIDALNRQARFAEAGAIRRLYARHIQADMLQRHAAEVGAMPAVPFRESESLVAARWSDLRGQVANFTGSSATGSGLTTPKSRANPPTDLSQHGRELARICSTAPGVIGKIISFRDPGAQDIPATMPAPSEAGILRIAYSVGAETTGYIAMRDGEMLQGTLAPSPEELALEIADLRDNIHSFDGWLPPARRLYSWLIGPVASLLRGATQIEIAATGVLEQLPFACLKGRGKFLCEHAPIIFVADGSGAQYEKRDTHLVAFAGQDGSGASALTAVRDETEDIAQLAPKSTLVPAAQFDRAALIKQLNTRPSHVHFAGHFHLRPTRPHLSSLIMGKGERLYLGELVEPEFAWQGLDLACFAACETGMVERGADGFESLAQVILDRGGSERCGHPLANL